MQTCQCLLCQENKCYLFFQNSFLCHQTIHFVCNHLCSVPHGQFANILTQQFLLCFIFHQLFQHLPQFYSCLHIFHYQCCSLIHQCHCIFCLMVFSNIRRWN